MMYKITTIDTDSINILDDGTMQYTTTDIIVSGSFVLSPHKLNDCEVFLFKTSVIDNSIGVCISYFVDTDADGNPLIQDYRYVRQ